MHKMEFSHEVYLGVVKGATTYGGTQEAKIFLIGLPFSSSREEFGTGS